MDFKESKTYQNLQTAMKSELISGAKYMIYSQKAHEDGYNFVGDIFEETSRNEIEHGKIWFKLLVGGKIPPTLDNIREAANGENNEWNSMYPEYAKTAREEGYDEIAELFERVSRVENNHDARFETLAWDLESGQIFSRENEAVWHCRNCGYLEWAKCVPKECPTCSYPKSYFQLYCEPF
jgi:rubrerythrin